MKPRKPIRRTWLRKKAKKARVLKSGRVILDAEGIAVLRIEVYHRANGKCEHESGCLRRAPWDGWNHGEMHHKISKGRGGSDTLENCVWFCGFHHDAAHGIKRIEYA